MGIPLIILRPLASRHENDKLAQFRWQHAFETKVIAQAASPSHNLGASKKGNPRSGRFSTGCDEIRDGLLLFIRQFVRGYRRHSILGVCIHTSGQDHNKKCDANDRCLGVVLDHQNLRFWVATFTQLTSGKTEHCLCLETGHSRVDNMPPVSTACNLLFET